MLKKYSEVVMLVIVSGFFLAACGQEEADSIEKEQTENSAQIEQKVVDDVSTNEETLVKESASEASQKAEETIAAVKGQAQETMVDVKASAEEKVAEVVAAASDKPYQLIDGKISANELEGWKTYNGGGCGACHGKGAVGSVGPNIGESIVNKISREEFVKIVTNGKPGTLMRPNSANKRVMDNMDNLYAYLYARGDGTLGPGNLLKLPLGK